MTEKLAELLDDLTAIKTLVEANDQAPMIDFLESLQPVEIARSMVKEYGMSPKISQVYFAREKKKTFWTRRTAAPGKRKN